MVSKSHIRNTHRHATTHARPHTTGCLEIEMLLLLMDCHQPDNIHYASQDAENNSPWQQTVCPFGPS